jgi:hypothetical protein
VWRAERVGSVLLVGDADVLPVRYMVLDRNTPAAFDYAFYPSDLYYADVARADRSFDDWNAQSQGFHAVYFGEVRGEHNKSDPINFDGIDYRPELAVGRWPVSTPEEAAAVAAKTIAYERALDEHRIPARAGLICTGGWVDARAQFDSVGVTLAGWQLERRYFKDGPAFDTPPPSEAEILSLIKGGAGLILHAGHGSDHVWDGCLSSGSIRSMANAPMFPVMISAGCSTARFATLAPYEAYEDATGVEHTGTNDGEVFTGPPPPPACYAKGRHNFTGLGEMLVRSADSGAIVYIGCNTGSQPCGLILQEGFVDALANDPHATAGDCWRRAVSYYYDHQKLATVSPTEDWYPASIFFQGMKFMFYGDPTVHIASPR